MEVQCMYYDKRYTVKPVNGAFFEVQKHLATSKAQTIISLENLAEGMSDGASFKPALLKGSKSVDWLQQQLFALDFDEDTTIQEQLDKCKELNINPIFGYTSFSHKPEHHKFRVVFCCDEVITDVEIRNKLQLTLINTFDKSDVKTKDATRIFFGGKSLIHKDLDARINANDIISRFYKPEWTTQPKTIKIKNTTNPKRNKHDIQDNDNPSHGNMALKLEAIKTLNVGVMRHLLGLEDKETTNKENFLLSVVQESPSCEDAITIFTCEHDLYSYINSIDLNEFLGIPFGKKVCCIFPDHEDLTPSANIYREKSGTSVYKCFGCDRSRTIITTVELLAGCSRSKAIEFIKDIYGLKLEKSEWTQKQIEIMFNSIYYLSSEDFKISFPELSKLIRTRKSHLTQMLVHFTQFVKDDLSYNDNPLFFASYNTLMDVIGIKRENRMMISQSLVLFALLNMLIKVQPEDIPERELNRAKAIQKKYGHKRLTSFFAFPEYGTNLFEESEKIAKHLKTNNITLKGLCREYILRTFGKEKADLCYPQYKDENEQGTSDTSNERTIEIAKNVLETIEKQEYILESAIKTDTISELQWKRSIQEILNTYGLKKVKLNNVLKEKYDITCNGYPSVIIRNED